MTRIRSAASSLALTSLAFTVHAQTASFRGLGSVLSTPFYSEGLGVSGDGVVAVGFSTITGGFSPVTAAFRALPEQNMESVYQIAGVAIRATAASLDGSTIVGTADHGSFSPSGTQAFVFNFNTGPIEIGDLPGGVSVVPRSFAKAVSDDGFFVAGVGESERGTEAFLFDLTSFTFAALGDLAGGEFNSNAYGMSRDGRVVVGTSISGNGQEAFRWNATEGMLALGFLPTPTGVVKYSIAEAANLDGSVIVGESRSAASGNGLEAFRWTPSSGMVALGDLPGGALQSFAYAVSADGQTIVGRGSIQGTCGPFGCGSLGRAFIWDAQHGMRDLHLVLTELGVDLTGWNLTEARAVSRDGLTIVGTGTNPLGQTEAWSATLPGGGCAADFDDGSGTGTPDGGVTIDDLLYYLTLFAEGATRADIDDGTSTGTRDGGVTIEDLLYFLIRYEGGC